METRIHRFQQFLQGVGEDASWWEEAALDGAVRPGAPSPFPWIIVRLCGRRIRKLLTVLRPAAKWLVRMIFLSPLLILLRVPLAQQGHWAAQTVTLAFVALVVSFFVLISLFLALAGVGYLLSRGRPEVELPLVQGKEGRLAFGPWSLGEDDLPGAESRIKVRGRLASLGQTLGGSGELLSDCWFLDGRTPSRRARAVDFAVLSEGERPVVVRLESAPLVVAEPAIVRNLRRALEEEWWDGPGSDWTQARTLSLELGDEVEVTGSPDGEIADVDNFELGGVARAIAHDQGRQDAPYRSGSGRPAVLLRCTPQNPLWIRKV